MYSFPFWFTIFDQYWSTFVPNNLFLHLSLLPFGYVECYYSRSVPKGITDIAEKLLCATKQRKLFRNFTIFMLRFLDKCKHILNHTTKFFLAIEFQFFFHFFQKIVHFSYFHLITEPNPSHCFLSSSYYLLISQWFFAQMNELRDKFLFVWTSRHDCTVNVFPVTCTGNPCVPILPCNLHVHIKGIPCNLQSL